MGCYPPSIDKQTPLENILVTKTKIISCSQQFRNVSKNTCTMKGSDCMAEVCLVWMEPLWHAARLSGH